MVDSSSDESPRKEHTIKIGIPKGVKH